MKHDTARLIGSGGMGEVYRAWDPDLERHVALKYLRHANGEMVERLLREARAQARIVHPGVCKVYEVGEEDGLPFIAMEFVEGQLLDKAVEAMTLEQKVLVVKLVAEAVQAAHSEGLIHRDLKPGNIIVAEGPSGEPHPYVLDFGIAREILDRGSERIERELVDRPETRARLLGIMGQVYSHLRLYDRALPLLEGALEQIWSLPEHDVQSEIEARVRLADLCMHRSEIDRVAELVEPIPRMVASSPDLDPAVAAQALGSLGRAQALSGNFVQASQTITQAVELAERELGTDSTLVGDLLTKLAYLSYNQKQWERAIAEGRRALEIRERAYGPDDPRVVTTLTCLALSLRGADRLEEAATVGERVLDYRERTLGQEHPRTGTALNNLGLVYKKMGRLDRAEELYLKALDVRRRALGEDHPLVSTMFLNLAGVYLERGELDRAEDSYRKAVGIVEAALGPDHPNGAHPIAGLAKVAAARGRHAEAERLSLRGLSIRAAAFGEDSPSLVGALTMLGESRLAQGKLDAAVDSLERARRLAVTAYGEDDRRVVRVDEVLAEVEAARGADTNE